MNLADNCPACLAGPFQPTRTVHYPESVVSHYRCLECKTRWLCSWLLSALECAA